MVAENREHHRTDFSVSVDAAEGITTGISAYDRWKTIAILADLNAKPDSLVQPGHVFPLRAKPGGVLRRAGHTEAAVDLALLAGLPPIGVICELMNEDGSVSRLPDLLSYKEKLGVKMISIAALIEYRHHRDRLVERVATQAFPHAYGNFQLHVFRSILDDRQHYALSAGELGPDPTLVRVHRENVLRDALGGNFGGTSNPIDLSLKRIAEEGRGILLYLSQPGGGVDLKAFETGRPFEAPKMDFRDYGIGAQILVELGLKQIRLMSSTSRNVVGLEGFNLEIVEQVEVS
jgi:3,4-dihydroxy 2-butanone 4-phosphate synthase/GTP cyclohydrolase II